MSGTEYAICVRDCQVQLFPEFIPRVHNLNMGTLIKIFDRRNDTYNIKYTICLKSNISYSNDIYKCNINNIKPISYDLFLLLIAVKREMNRIKIINDDPLINYIRSLEINKIITMPGRQFNRNDFNCVIKYIGYVDEIGPGIYFGFVIMDPNVSVNVRGTLAQKYLKCNNSVGFIRSIDVFLKTIDDQNVIRSFNSINQISRVASMESVNSDRSYNHHPTQPHSFNQHSDLGYSQKSKINSPYASINVPTYKVNKLSNPSIMDQPLIEFEKFEDTSELLGSFQNSNKEHHNIKNIRFEPVNHMPFNSNLKQVPMAPFQANPQSMAYFLSNNNSNKLIQESILDTRSAPNSRSKQHLFRDSNNFERAPPHFGNISSNFDKNPRPLSFKGFAQNNSFEESNIYGKGNRDPAFSQNYNKHQNILQDRDLLDTVSNLEKTTLNSPRLQKECLLISCPINNPSRRNKIEDFDWNGISEVYTNSRFSDNCGVCNDQKIKCIANSFINKELKLYIDVLKGHGFDVSYPQNTDLSIRNTRKASVTQKTKIDKELYYVDKGNKIPIYRNRHLTECSNCKSRLNTSQAICLKNCLHMFCRKCLSVHIETNLASNIHCIFKNDKIECLAELQKHEIQYLANPLTYQKYLQFKIDKKLLNKENNVLHCKKKNCHGWIVMHHNDEANFFNCLVCGATNCRSCDAIHQDVTCELFLQKQKNNALIRRNAIENQNKILPKELDENKFYCKTKDCKGVLEINPKIVSILFCCPVCNVFNCRNCKAIHTGLSCTEYQNRTEKNDNVQKKEQPFQMLLPDQKLHKQFACKAVNCGAPIHLNLENDMNFIACPTCETLNCRRCEAVHKGLTCKEFLKDAADGFILDDIWECVQCTYVNIQNEFNCEMCGEIKAGIVDEEDEESDTTEEDEKLFEKLLELENADLIRNDQQFECLICYSTQDPGKGVKLRECLHEFCEECIIGQIKASEDAVVKCPYYDDSYSCDYTLQDREVKALATEEIYLQYLNRSLREGKGNIENSFACKTPDCEGFWSYDEGISNHICDICKERNCHQCNAIHPKLTCQAYQDKVFNTIDPASMATKAMFEEMLENEKAMRCPTCEVIIVREEGCSWLVCTMCKTEICWATRGPRWGPAGKGDISAGCKCDYKNNKPCHANCKYCH